MAMREGGVRARGWTLTELLMTVAVVGILASVAAPILVQFQRFYRLTDAKTRIQRDVRQSLDQINRFLRQAYASTIVIDQAGGQPPYSRITFTMVDGKSVQYFQEGTTLYGVVSGVTTKMSENLRYIAFTFPRSDDSTIISVSMTMERSTYNLQTKALQLSIEKVRVMN